MKKILSFIMIGSVLLSSSTMWAQEKEVAFEEKVKVINLTENITDECIDEITDSVSASLVYQDGTMVPTDMVITIEDISNTNSRNISNLIEKRYQVTVEASVSEVTDEANARKIVNDSAYKNGDVVASATLQIIWTDVFGPENILNEVSGTLEVVSGTVKSGTVKYGDGFYSAVGWTEKNVGSRKSFTYNPNETAFIPTADYWVYFKDELFGLHLSVSSSLFQ